jgi:hypothetical protein
LDTIIDTHPKPSKHDGNQAENTVSRSATRASKV